MYRIITLLLLLFNVSCTVLPQSQKPIVLTTSDFEIPSVGLGLWNSEKNDATKSIGYAFKTGYKHLDGAAAYNNEKYVGKALNAKGAPKRSDYWLTSKLWNTMHKPENVPKAFKKTLSDLNTPYLDLYLMHWPVAFLPNRSGRSVLDEGTTIVDTWKAMEKLVSKNRTHPEPGTTRHIGISNFSPRQVDQIRKICTICPYAHEFETHPYLQQQEYVNWHNAHGIKVIAYSPLANLNPTYKGKHPELPRLLDNPFWKDVAKQKNITVAQAVLGWGVARGTIVIPKSVHQDRIVENLKSAEVKYSKQELSEIAQQDKGARFNDPGRDWGVKLFEDLDDASE